MGARCSMRLVIAEDEPLVREGLSMVLAANGFEVAEAVADADELRAAVTRAQPEVVVTDVRMPPNRADDGLQAAIELRQRDPPVRVLVLSAHIVPVYARELFGTRPHGVGYLLKSRISDVASFCHDVRRVGEGGTVLDPEVVAAMMARTPTDPLKRLTVRQQEVLGLIAEGRSNAAIATKLGITEKAVARHASLIYDALDIAPSLEDHRRVIAVVQLLTRPDSSTTGFPQAPSTRR